MNIYDDPEVKKLLQYEIDSDNPNDADRIKSDSDRQKLHHLVRSAKAKELSPEHCKQVLSNRGSLAKVKSFDLWNLTTNNGSYKKEKQKGRQDVKHRL